eukprot:TRINITY_DN101755_c0_g1_i1.p1 TRINITY_DN101755_c0_g1~~TRINITY_DN101755_c0_g1_i1.p1  ORF type:complete len:392 (-),score=71.41 TRINITY_DN101755_c0_g1_i1:206-1381(-)
MTPASEEKLTQLLEPVEASSGPDIGAFNITLRDAVGNALHLEAFYIHIAAGGETEARYLLGVRESTKEETRFGVLPESSAGLAPSHRELPPEMSSAKHLYLAEHSESSYVSSTTSEDEDRMAVPYKLATTLDAKVRVIDMLLKQVNFGAPSFDACCRKHADLMALQQVIQARQEGLCHAGFCYHTMWQCPVCGIMTGSQSAGSECRGCGQHEGARPASRDSRREAEGLQVGDKEETSAGETKKDSSACSTGTGSFSAEDGCWECQPSGPQLLPRLAKTSELARDALIKDALGSLNFPVANYSKPHCCHLHDALAHFARRVAEMQLMPCDCTFSSYSAWQCGTCGVLGPAVPLHGQCSLCTQSGRVPPPVIVNTYAPSSPSVYGRSVRSVDL